MFDLEALRAQFPSLASGVAHFDGPGGTQTPLPVAEAISATILGPLSNRGVVGESERRAEATVAAFRSAFADFLGFPANGIVYGRSATQLTYDFSRTLAKQWQPGDEVVVTRLDHDANVRPWLQAAAAVGASVKWLDLDPATAELDLDTVATAIGPRTRLVALTGASNVLGTIPPHRVVADAAHAVGALLYVDAVHLAAHEHLDPVALGADLMVCSPYKFFGPHCAVLGADPALLETLWPDKLTPSTDQVPERFELGTLPYEIMAGATAAVDFLASLAGTEGGSRRERLRLAYSDIDAHETRLRTRLEDGLARLGVISLSRAAHRTTTVLVDLGGRNRAAYEFLAERSILAPAGNFYGYEPLRRLGLADGLRIGLAPYTTLAEIDRLLEALAEFLSE